MFRFPIAAVTGHPRAQPQRHAGLSPCPCRRGDRVIHKLGLAVIAAMIVAAPPVGAQVPQKVNRIAVLSAALPRN